MQRTHQWLVVTLAAFVLALSAGCGGLSSGPTVKSTARSAAEYFREHQGSTVTPHGTIRMGTVVEKNGKLQYQTEDNKSWRVGYVKRADGTYEYQTPEEVKEGPGS